MIRRILAVAAATAALFGVSLAPAMADGANHYHITGSFLELAPDSFVKVNPTPPSVYVGVDVHPISYDGSLVGTSTSTEHTAANPTGGFETHNIEAWDNVTVTATDGTVLGTGSLVINFNAHGAFVLDSDGNVADGSWMTGVFQIVSAGGGLAGLHGSGTVVGVPGSIGGHGTYTGTVSF